MARYSKTTYYLVAAIGKNNRPKSYVKTLYDQELAVSFADTLNCAAQKFNVYKRVEAETLIYDGEKEFAKSNAAEGGEQKTGGTNDNES